MIPDIGFHQSEKLRFKLLKFATFCYIEYNSKEKKVATKYKEYTKKKTQLQDLFGQRKLILQLSSD